MLKAVMKMKNLIFYVFFQEIVLRDNCGRENKKPDRTIFNQNVLILEAAWYVLCNVVQCTHTMQGSNPFSQLHIFMYIFDLILKKFIVNHIDAMSSLKERQYILLC